MAVVLSSILTLASCFSAVYLCKRTMQNKARLELADYEAVRIPRTPWLNSVCTISDACMHHLPSIPLIIRQHFLK